MKKIVSVMLAAVMIVSMTACQSSKDQTASAGTEPADTKAKTASDSGASKEAPVLADRVAAGDLPALEERLPVPSDIMVETDSESVGQYGGSMTMTTNDDGRWGWGPTTEQGMFRFKQDGSGEVEPNVAKEFSANEDATVWTIKLREGMRWSNGEPFTADDVIFYYDHMSTPALDENRVALDSEDPNYYSTYTSKPYNCYQVLVDGKMVWADFEKVNDYEVTITFAAPKPSFAVDVTVDNKWMFLPKHFYINYVARKDGVADDTTFPLITEEEALANANKDFGKAWDSYSAMSRDIGYFNWDYAIVPQVRSFIAVKDNWNAVGETYKLVRNPYFWKTDSEGNQLPYLDSIDYKIINDEAQKTLAAMGGELDFYEKVITDYSTVASSLKDTTVVNDWITAEWSTDENLQLNQTVKDLDKRAMFQDIRFRQALSMCVDRDLMNETLRNGVSTPAQASVQEGLDGYSKTWQTKWTKYDVKAANALLDEVTEPWDGTKGTFRKMKGTDKDAEIIVSIKEPSISGDFISLLKTAYAAVGVRLTDKVDADYRTTMLSNDVEASVEITSVSSPAIRPDSIIPMRNVAVWHSAWGKWYEDGKSTAGGGVEPTGDALELINLYEKMRTASGSDREAVVDECIKQIYELHEKNVWLIGYLAPLPVHNIINKHIQNVPSDLLYVDEFRFVGLARPEQFWRDDVNEAK